MRRAHASDASGLHLVPEGVARPASEAEVAGLLRGAAAERTPVTAAMSTAVPVECSETLPEAVM